MPIMVRLKRKEELLSQFILLSSDDGAHGAVVSDNGVTRASDMILY